ncbi:peptidylprolyl isomerase [Hominiventricola aquisgranensis]|jgi:putative peptidyl-prolyl cis-trans isomerse D|uniref:Peptidylprolyl isomerase n=1 Tax=Hominiventricola aquisgranensis TaxID=3133164 RepID=A0ABV1HYV4_9FIRM|nr:peptidylprolyl isomerase [Clostridiaceae bacterium AF42-6]DAH89373.1 MAG TPA: Head-to-tail joining protein W (GpW), fast protein folding, downhill [Caudoviricetes sp.]
MADTISKQEMLDGLNKAIYAITVGGQSYKIGSRSLTRADLKQLYAMKNDMEAQIAREEAGDNGLLGDCYVGVFDGR